MGYVNEGPYHSFGAAASIDPHRFVTGSPPTGDAYVKMASDDSLFIAGVAPDGAVSGTLCRVQLYGIAKVQVGTGGVTAWERVTSDADGKAVAWFSGPVGGLALEDRAEGEIAPVLLQLG